jgi:hypothetical protein
MDKAKKKSFNQFGIFHRQNYRDFGTPQQFEFISWKSHQKPWKAIFTSSTVNKREDMKSGIDLILGIIPSFLQL